MKKPIMLISLCLAVVMILPICAAAAFASGGADLPFRDVKAGKWYYGNVKYVFKNGIMKGTSDTEFSPEGTLTRAMCVTIIYRAAEEPAFEGESSFSDVPEGEYYAKPVAWAEEMGIVHGKTRKLYAPDDAITRAEFATMMYRYLYGANLDLKETKNSDPSDYSAIPSYAQEAVTVMYRSGVLNGKENGRFDPDAPITRAETAAIIERFNDTAVRFVQEDDGVLDVAFIGDSFTAVPRMFDHFEALAEGKHAVKAYNEVLNATSLKGHYEAWTYYRKEKNYFIQHWQEMRKWDVVILNENGAGAPLGLKDEFQLEYEFVGEALGFSSFDDFCNILEEDRFGYKYYILLTELFGDDKEYYNLCESTIMKKDIGTEIRVEETFGDGLFWHIFKGNDPESISQNWCASNTLNFLWKDWLKENCNVNRIMINCTTFDPDNPLDPRDFDHIRDKGDYHPNLMYGYCFALALYCTIYDEPCAEQNNGILTDDDIPGDTPEEKVAYMTMIKDMIQEELDFQNSH